MAKAMKPRHHSRGAVEKSRWLLPPFGSRSKADGSLGCFAGRNNGQGIHIPESYIKRIV